MFLDRAGFEVFPEPTSSKIYLENHQGATDKDVPEFYGKAPAIKMEVVDDGLLNHVGNLLECMRSRTHPQSDIEYGHRSTTTCLLGNVALRSQGTSPLGHGKPDAVKCQSCRHETSWPRIPRTMETDCAE